MASIKLTQHLRLKLREKILAHAFDSRFEALRLEGLALGNKVYEYLYPKEVQDLMSKLPAGFFNKDSEVWVKAGAAMPHLSLGEERLVSSGEPYRRHNIEDPALCAAIESFYAKREALRLERYETTQLVAERLAAYNTTKQLVQGWPEAAQFLESSKEDTTCKDVELLNQKLGLKKAKGKK